MCKLVFWIEAIRLTVNVSLSAYALARDPWSPALLCSLAAAGWKLGVHLWCEARDWLRRWWAVAADHVRRWRLGR